MYMCMSAGLSLSFYKLLSNAHAVFSFNCVAKVSIKLEAKRHAKISFQLEMEGKSYRPQSVRSKHMESNILSIIVQRLSLNRSVSNHGRSTRVGSNPRRRNQ